MIPSYRDRRTETFAEGERVREFAGFERQGWKSLAILEAATSLADLRALPSNRLESLKGDRAGQFSIHINAQWRICFSWPGRPTSRSSTITEGDRFTMSRPPIHPGEILADELAEIGITAAELARQTAVPQDRVGQIVRGRRAITGDMALRLGHWFGNSAQFWLNLQSAYDLRVAETAAGDEIARLPIRPWEQPTAA